MAILLDTSALVAILTNEANAADLCVKLLASQARFLPATCAAEAALVLWTKLNQDPEALLSEFYREFGIEVIPFGPHHLGWFHHATSTYGKGRHKAGLNFGDCFTYAIAKATGIPLLFTGNDFTLTDLSLA